MARFLHFVLNFLFFEVTVQHTNCSWIESGEPCVQLWVRDPVRTDVACPIDDSGDNSCSWRVQSIAACGS